MAGAGGPAALSCLGALAGLPAPPPPGACFSLLGGRPLRLGLSPWGEASLSLGERLRRGFFFSFSNFSRGCSHSCVPSWEPSWPSAEISASCAFCSAMILSINSPEISITFPVGRSGTGIPTVSGAGMSNLICSCIPESRIWVLSSSTCLPPLLVVVYENTAHSLYRAVIT